MSVQFCPAVSTLNLFQSLVDNVSAGRMIACPMLVSDNPKPALIYRLCLAVELNDFAFGSFAHTAIS